MAFARGSRSIWVVVLLQSCGICSTTFVYVDQELSWTDAREYCRTNHHDLASIHSSTENAEVDALCPVAWCWIGGSDSASEGTWTWLDGSAWDYENWLTGQPGQWQANTGEDYMLIEGAKWHDAFDWHEVPFVCRDVASPGYVMTDSNIYAARDAWLSDSAAAEAAYGHISTWETGGVTDMSCLFVAASSYSCDVYNTAAASFNEDISAWDTSGVTRMDRMFSVSAFNQDIGAWDTSGVTRMDYMFYYASAFDQNIGAWDTSGVTTMELMFTEASAFNQDLSGWRVDNVRNMFAMFKGASSFNQDISGWAVDSVTDMSFMFDQAYSFDQDLGWCVDDDVSMARAFSGTPCSLTSCGVKQAAGGCAPTPAPTTPAPTPASTPAPTPTPTVTPRKKSSSGGGAILFAGDGAIAALLLAVGACYFCCRRRKASTMDKADGPSSANPEPTELPPPDEESLETRAAAEAKAAETAERPGLARKLSSFLFGEQEEEPTALTVAEAEEAPPAEQPPPLPPRRTEPEPAAKAEEMYNQIAAWYSEPENAALRKIWGAYPDPDDFQTWPGFVAVTNAFLDREAG